MPIFRRLSLDLGTANSLIYDLEHGMLLQEPSVIAYEAESAKVIAWGHEAELLRGRCTPQIKIERPLKHGVIDSPDAAELMLSQFMKMALKRSLWFAPRVIACVPTGASAIERRALRETIEASGAQARFLIDEPIAAAIGAGLSLTKPVGHTVVDIGGGTSEIAVISMTGIICSESIDVAGDVLTKVIQRHIKQEHKTLISFESAEYIKHNVASVYPEANSDQKDVIVSGTSLLSNLPVSISINGGIIREILTEPIKNILMMIRQTLEQLPPELAADTAELGLTLVGGGALLNGLSKLIEEEFQIAVNIPVAPVNCAVLGASEAMINAKKYSYFLQFVR